MRFKIIALSMLCVPLAATVAEANGSRPAQVSVGINYPGVSVGINMPAYPQLIPVPGYPVYYDPNVNSNYFFYDGLYWVFQGDNWYASSWYNGPWDMIGYDYVPLYVLRVPVRYYRQPPTYFRGWRDDAPPHWGEHWGRDWEQRRSGWDKWDHRASPAAAPLPAYQREYAGERYPRAAEQQRSIESEHYRYQPREPVTQQYIQRQGQPNQQRQQEQQRLQEQQGQQRQSDQQHQQDQQRQQEQQRSQDQQWQQQRKLEQERQQNQQHSQGQQQQQDQQHQQDKQRQQGQQQQEKQLQAQQRQKDEQHQQNQQHPDQGSQDGPQDRGGKPQNEGRDQYR